MATNKFILSFWALYGQIGSILVCTQVCTPIGLPADKTTVQKSYPVDQLATLPCSSSIGLSNRTLPTSPTGQTEAFLVVRIWEPTTIVSLIQGNKGIQSTAKDNGTKVLMLRHRFKIMQTSSKSSRLYVLSSSAKKTTAGLRGSAWFRSHSRAVFRCLTPRGFFHWGSYETKNVTHRWQHITMMKCKLKFNLHPRVISILLEFLHLNVYKKAQIEPTNLWLMEF